MADYTILEERLSESISLTRRPIAVAFRETLPLGVPKFAGTEPSGCSFWRLAMHGQAFYTVAADHYNCPIGSFTHNIPLPVERAPELEGTLSLMSQIGYLGTEEVSTIPQLPHIPRVIVYAPLSEHRSIRMSCCSSAVPPR